MSRQVGYKFRIYPTVEQQSFISRHFGCVRYIYNYLLKYRSELYKQKKISVSGFEAKRMISKLKKTEECKWLKEVNSQSLQGVALDLDRGFKRFFKKKSDYPKFKKKHGRQSFKIPQHFLLKKSKNDRWFLYIPKLKSGIRVEVHREVIGVIKRITISQDPDGCYYASLNCEVMDDNVPGSKIGKAVGIDLGLSSFVTTSDGEKIEPAKCLRKLERSLRSKQRKLSKKQKGSSNRRKARKKVAILHQKIKNQRKDFLHKVSNRLVNDNQVICLEDLNVKGMSRNRHLSKSIADAGWSEFVRQLKYKAQWRGKVVIQIGRFEPSSKLCSSCSNKNGALSLSERSWVCEACGASHDRDINAAINILKLGQGMPDYKPVEKVATISSFKRIQAGSVKQEAVPKPRA